MPDGARGTRIRIEGRVLDGAGEPVSDAMLEVWQANADGRYDHPADPRGDAGLDDAFHGFARLGTDAAGGFRLETVKPGPVPGARERMAGAAPQPHRVRPGPAPPPLDAGLLRRRGRANAADPVLRAIDPARRGTLVAALDAARPSSAAPRLPLRHPPPGGRRDGVPRLLSRSGSPAAARPRIRCGAWPLRRRLGGLRRIRPAPRFPRRLAPAPRSRPGARGLW